MVVSFDNTLDYKISKGTTSKPFYISEGCNVKIDIGKSNRNHKTKVKFINGTFSESSTDARTVYDTIYQSGTITLMNAS